MIGSPPSRSRKTRQLLAILALPALIAAACGGDSTDIASDDAAVPADTTTAAPADTTAPETTSAPAQTTAPAAAVEPAETTAPAESVVPADDQAGSSAPLAQVLALAVDNSESQSYSFSQGMAMRVNIGGQNLDIAPQEAYVFGEVQDGSTHLNMDMGTLMGAIFESTGLDVTQPPFDELFAGLDDANIEFWADEQTLVMDMSSFASTLGSLNPQSASDVAALADGPVSFDLTQLDGIDAASLANQYGQGAQVTNPSEILQALRAADAISETGTDQVNGVDVRVFSATLSMADYSEALGINFTDQLGPANLGAFDGGPEEEIAAALLPAMEQLEVGLVVMVDADDLVRRLEVGLDFGAIFEAMFTNADVLEAIATEDGITREELESEVEFFGPDGIEMTVDTWQEFDNYGQDFNIVVPDAVDVTGELDLAR